MGLYSLVVLVFGLVLALAWGGVLVLLLLLLLRFGVVVAVDGVGCEGCEGEEGGPEEEL